MQLNRGRLVKITSSCALDDHDFAHYLNCRRSSTFKVLDVGDNAVRVQPVGGTQAEWILHTSVTPIKQFQTKRRTYARPT